MSKSTISLNPALSGHNLKGYKIMFILQNTPLSILNRALDLYGQDEEENIKKAWDALSSAQGCIDVHCPDIGGARITPFAQAVAEYLSCSGPWDVKTGYIENEGDFRTML